jgi:hypothetical protein
VFPSNAIKLIKSRRMMWLASSTPTRQHKYNCRKAFFLEKSERKKPFGILRHAWEDNIKWMLRDLDGRLLIGKIWGKIGWFLYIR